MKGHVSACGARLTLDNVAIGIVVVGASRRRPSQQLVDLIASKPLLEAQRRLLKLNEIFLLVGGGLLLSSP